MTWTQTLRQRWWLLPIAILVVAAAIVIRIITTPLEVSANVNDGDQAVPRTATIDLHFNQEMKPASVQHAFIITPSVPVSLGGVRFHRWPQGRPEHLGAWRQQWFQFQNRARPGHCRRQG